jgi:hypothetical protein
MHECGETQFSTVIFMAHNPECLPKFYNPIHKMLTNTEFICSTCHGRLEWQTTAKWRKPSWDKHSWSWPQPIRIPTLTPRPKSKSESARRFSNDLMNRYHPRLDI